VIELSKIFMNGCRCETIVFAQIFVCSVTIVELCLPFAGSVAIRQLSSMMTQLKTSDGITIEWDGETRLYLKVIHCCLNLIISLSRSSLHERRIMKGVGS